MISHDTRNPPKVSIGMPVYNGEPYITGAIESVLGQNYSNLEFIICDNASTDGTFDLCRTFAAGDSRIRLYRNESNIGSAANFNRVLELADGPYFTWAAHDDLVHPTYIAKCVRALEDNPSVVICGSDVTFIDETGASVDPGEYNRLDTFGMTLRGRVKSLTTICNWYSLYGVARTSALRRTRKVNPSFGCDVVLLMELLFQGETMVLPERLFTYRILAKTTERYMNDVTGRPESLTPKLFTGLARELLQTIETSGFPIAVRTEMREDLLENVTAVNIRWHDLLIGENPELHNILPRYLVPMEMRRKLWDRFTGAELDDLRARAFATFVSRLPLRERISHKVRRYMDRHVLWRFQAKS